MKKCLVAAFVSLCLSFFYVNAASPYREVLDELMTKAGVAVDDSGAGGIPVSVTVTTPVPTATPTPAPNDYDIKIAWGAMQFSYNDGWDEDDVDGNNNKIVIANYGQKAVEAVVYFEMAGTNPFNSEAGGDSVKPILRFSSDGKDSNAAVDVLTDVQNSNSGTLATAIPAYNKFMEYGYDNTADQFKYYWENRGKYVADAYTAIAEQSAHFFFPSAGKFRARESVPSGQWTKYQAAGENGRWMPIYFGFVGVPDNAIVDEPVGTIKIKLFPYEFFDTYSYYNSADVSDGYEYEPYFNKDSGLWEVLDD